MRTPIPTTGDVIRLLLPAFENSFALKLATNEVMRARGCTWAAACCYLYAEMRGDATLLSQLDKYQRNRLSDTANSGNMTTALGRS